MCMGDAQLLVMCRGGEQSCAWEMHSYQLCLGVIRSHVHSAWDCMGGAQKIRAGDAQLRALKMDGIAYGRCTHGCIKNSTSGKASGDRTMRYYLQERHTNVTPLYRVIDLQLLGP